MLSNIICRCKIVRCRNKTIFKFYRVYFGMNTPSGGGGQICSGGQNPQKKFSRFARIKNLLVSFWPPRPKSWLRLWCHIPLYLSHTNILGQNGLGNYIHPFYAAIVSLSCVLVTLLLITIYFIYPTLLQIIIHKG